MVLWTKTLGHKLFILQDDMGNKILKEVCLCLIIEYIKINNNISQKFDFTMTLLAKYHDFIAPSSDRIKNTEKMDKTPCFCSYIQRKKRLDTSEI